MLDTALPPTPPLRRRARTRKGRGVSEVEDRNGLHGKPFDEPEAAIAAPWWI